MTLGIADDFESHGMMQRISETSPRVKARIAGASYVLSVVVAYSPSFSRRASWVSLPWSSLSQAISL